MLKRFSYFLTHHHVEYIEAMSGFAGSAWGVWLLNPHWNTFAASKGYMSMATIAPEAFWGSLMLFFGLSQLIVLMYPRQELLRVIIGAVMTGMWSFIAAMLALGNLAGTGVPIYSTFAIFTLWTVVRLTQRYHANRG